MSLTSGFGSQNSERDLLRKNRRRKGDENVDPNKEDDKKRQSDDFLRYKLRDVTSQSLDSVFRNPNENDSFGVEGVIREYNEVNATQYDNKSGIDGLFKEHPQPVEGTNQSLDMVSRKRKRNELNDYGIQGMKGMQEAFQMRGMLENSDTLNGQDIKRRRLEDSDALNGQDIKKEGYGKLTDTQQEEGQKILERTVAYFRARRGKSGSESEKVKPQEIPEGINKVRDSLYAVSRNEKVHIESYDKALKQAKKEVEDLEKSNDVPKNASDGSNFKVTPEMFESIAKKLEEGSKVSDASRSESNPELDKLLKGLRKKSDSGDSKPKHDQEQQKNVSEFFRGLWKMLFETTHTGEQSEEMPLEDLPEPAQKLIKGWQADRTIDEQAYNDLGSRLKADGGASILADLKKKHERMDAKQNTSKT